MKKTTKVKVEPTKVKAEVKVVSENSKASENSKPMDKRLWLVAALVLMVALGYGMKNKLIVATVNGQPIWRANYIATLESQGGQQVLRNMVIDKLIAMEAQKQNVVVPKEKVDTEIATIEASLKEQGQDLNEALAAQRMTMPQLRQQLELQLMVDQMTQNLAQVSDEEVTQYIKENKANLSTEGVESEELAQMVKEQLLETKRQASFSAWLESLQQAAEVKYW